MRVRKLGIRFVLSCLLISTACLTLLVGAWGYTRARVANSVQVRITESGNALIAIKTEPRGAVQGETVPCGWITNHLPVSVSMGVEGFTLSTYQLMPGETATLAKSIPTRERLGLNSYDGVVRGIWEGGRADVRVNAQITVSSPPPSEVAVTWDTAAQQGTYINMLTVPAIVKISNSFTLTTETIQPGESLTFAKTGLADTANLTVTLPNGQVFEIAKLTP